MPLPILGGTKLADTGYDVANSCRFEDGDSPKLSKTMVAGDEDKWTMSMWVKRGNISLTSPTSRALFFAGSDNGVFFKSDDTLNFYHYTSSYVGQLITSRKFRDVGAWYHFVFVYDSGNATAGNRMRIYVNGVEETSFGTDTQPSQDANSEFNIADNVIYIGINNGTTTYFDGYMAEVVFCDGQAYAASDFGEFDEDSPTIWKPKDVSGLTFGNNGFYLDFEDSSNLGNDANGGTDLTEVNLAAADQATDTPTNNFATLNILDKAQSSATYKEGNLEWSTVTAGHYFWARSTIGVSSGKWYFEAKLTSASSYNHIGICDEGPADNTTSLESEVYGWEIKNSDGNVYNNESNSSYGDTFTTGDIIGVYLDLDNNKIYWAKNGTVQNSGTGVSITDPASTNTGNYFFCVTDNASGDSVTWEANFGNPSFAISSGNADAKGYGNFEYDPSSGTFDGASKDFLALCTKNLAEEG